MTAMNMRRYPIGVQTFSEIIRGEFIYVDKTDLIWDVTKESKYVFLSRPRRFGKSLLSSTLRAYFEGRKDLFEGLKIMQLEKQWTEYPVIHVDLSVCKGMADGMELRRKIMLLLKPYAESYGADDDETTPGGMLAGVIKRAWQKTGRQTVVIIDEYDAPLLDVLHTDEVLSEMRQAMQELQTYLEGIPYVEGFKKKLDNVSSVEGFYEYTLYLIFSMLNVYVRTQVKCRGGRIDMVVLMPTTTYVFELKTTGTAQEALAQIDDRGYGIAYQTEGRKVVKAGMLFNIEKRTLEDWAIES